MAIEFGTDGWRGIIADDFTFENVAKVALAAARFFKRQPNLRNGVVVGYDARFLSKEFAETTAQVLGSAGIRVCLAPGIVSTPMVSLGVKKLKAAGGVVITASHNPAKYNGFKVKGYFGGPAYPEMIADVERKLAKVKSVRRKLSLEELLDRKIVRYDDLASLYIEDIKGKIDIDLIRSAGFRIVFDAMHGAGQGVMQRILPGLTLLHNDFNPSFGGVNPEPIANYLTELTNTVREGTYDLGIATDGDADRLGAVDEKGEFIDFHRVFGIILKYLVEVKGLRGEVAKSFSVSDMIDKMCAKYGLALHTTPVGFKYLCRLMTERDILIASEESGGLGIRGHIPERDGIFVGLLMAEIMAARKKKLSELTQELFDEYGQRSYDRIDAHVTPKEKQAIIKRFSGRPKTIGSLVVRDVQTIDGFKFLFDEGWLLVRASGTEPLIRFYAEARTPDEVKALLADASGRTLV